MEQSQHLFVDFSQLVAGGKVNARGAADRNVGIDELAALIKAKGLLQPLIVRPRGQSLFEVTAGNRRLAAIGKLIKAKSWTGKVPVIVRKEGDDAALETSLIENIGRLPMHAVDQFEVFAKANAGGMDNAEIAARYGITEQTVRQRLALGGLAPELRSAWRAGDIDAKSAQIFALCPDKKLQAKTFKDLTAKGGHATQWRVEQALTTDSPKLNDPRVRFVGLDVYKAAGGQAVEDLFGDDGHIVDVQLLKELVEKAITQTIDRLLADGWSWAERLPNGKSAWQLQKNPPGQLTYSAEETKRIAHLERAAKALETQEELISQSDANGSTLDEIERAQEAIRDELDAMKETALARSYSPKQKAKLGCMIEIGDGVARVHYGVDAEKNKGAGKPAAAKLDLKGKAAESTADMSQALLQDLTTRQTKAAAAVLSHTPLAALLTLVATLARSSGSPAKISANGYNEVRDGTAGRHATFEAVLKSIDGLEVTALLDKLATLVASSLDLRCFSHSSMSTPAALPSTAAMISLLHPDQYREAMLAQFDHADYFKRSPAAAAVAAIKEITDGKLNPHESIGKKALVSTATERAKAAGWLPVLLRHPGDAKPAKAKTRGRK